MFFPNHPRDFRFDFYAVILLAVFFSEIAIKKCKKFYKAKKPWAIQIILWFKIKLMNKWILIILLHFLSWFHVSELIPRALFLVWLCAKSSRREIIRAHLKKHLLKFCIFRKLLNISFLSVPKWLLRKRNIH